MSIQENLQDFSQPEIIQEIKELVPPYLKEEQITKDNSEQKNEEEEQNHPQINLSQMHETNRSKPGQEIQNTPLPHEQTNQNSENQIFQGSERWVIEDVDDEEEQQQQDSSSSESGSSSSSQVEQKASLKVPVLSKKPIVSRTPLARVPAIRVPRSDSSSDEDSEDDDNVDDADEDMALDHWQPAQEEDEDQQDDQDISDDQFPEDYDDVDLSQIIMNRSMEETKLMQNISRIKQNQLGLFKMKKVQKTQQYPQLKQIYEPSLQQIIQRQQALRCQKQTKIRTLDVYNQCYLTNLEKNGGKIKRQVQLQQATEIVQQKKNEKKSLNFIDNIVVKVFKKDEAPSAMKQKQEYVEEINSEDRPPRKNVAPQSSNQINEQRLEQLQRTLVMERERQILNQIEADRKKIQQAARKKLQQMKQNLDLQRRMRDFHQRIRSVSIPPISYGGVRLSRIQNQTNMPIRKRSIDIDQIQFSPSPKPLHHNPTQPIDLTQVNTQTGKLVCPCCDCIITIKLPSPPIQSDEIIQTSQSFIQPVLFDDKQDQRQL